VLISLRRSAVETSRNNERQQRKEVDEHAGKSMEKLKDVGTPAGSSGSLDVLETEPALRRKRSFVRG
jgi:hypothetical protein